MPIKLEANARAASLNALSSRSPAFGFPKHRAFANYSVADEFHFQVDWSLGQLFVAVLTTRNLIH